LYASSSCSIRTLSLPAALPILAKNTLDAGDFGYGLLYGAIGVGLVGGSFWSSALVDRIGIARAYGIALAVGACDADPVDERAAPEAPADEPNADGAVEQAVPEVARVERVLRQDRKSGG